MWTRPGGSPGGDRREPDACAIVRAVPGTDVRGDIFPREGPERGATAVVQWEQALAAVRARHYRGADVLGVTEDTHRLIPGMVFVARPGRHADGHAFLTEARERGALLTVGERAVAADLPDVVVPDAAAALSHLVSAWWGDPGAGMVLVGVTGTNGKTTVAHLLAQILRAAGYRAGQVGTLGFRFEDDFSATHHTTPPPEVLYPLLCRWRDAGCTHVVMEVSAQALSQRRVAALRFAAAALTGFSRDHGEYYQDLQEYRRAKEELFSALTSGSAVLPRDDPQYAAFAAAAAGCRILTFGPGGEVQGEPAGTAELGGGRIRLQLPDERERVLHFPLPGMHNLRNALCAAATALSLGVQARAIFEGLSAAGSVPGRAMVLRAPGGMTAVVDYAHNPAALKEILRTVRAGTPGRLYAVLGPRGERDRGKRPLMGAILAAFADAAVITSDRPGSELPEEAAAPMLQAARDCGLRAEFVADRGEAIAMAAARLRRGDCLLVTGKGLEPWGAGDSAVLPASDAEILRRCVPNLVSLHEAASGPDRPIALAIPLSRA